MKVLGDCPEGIGFHVLVAVAVVGPALVSCQRCMLDHHVKLSISALLLEPLSVSSVSASLCRRSVVYVVFAVASLWQSALGSILRS